MIRPFHISLLLCVVLLVPAGLSSAQQIPRARVEGIVIDAESERPLDNAHIFVSRSSLGTISTDRGEYRFLLPVGAHRIVVSRVGYRTQTHDVMIRESRSYLLNISLDEEIISLGDLTISDVRDKTWDKNLIRFKEAFLGLTENAESIEILNPEVLHFLEKNGRLIATADTPLLLVNHRLGYEIEHHLHQFVIDSDETWQDGESAFTPMKPASDVEAAAWKANRLKAYLGSSQHFFRSVVTNRSRQEGFQVYLVEDPGVVGAARESERNFAAPLQKPQFAVNPFSLLEKGASENEFFLQFRKYVLIVYTREEEDPRYAAWQKVYHSGEPRDLQYSWIELRTGPATIDSQGNILDPYAFSFFGYMSFERLADLLPKEFRPD